MYFGHNVGRPVLRIFPIDLNSRTDLTYRTISLSLFYFHGSTLITASISNDIHYEKMGLGMDK